MRNAPVGTDLTFVIPYKVNGEPVEPTGVVVTVLDQDGAVMHGPVVLNTVPGNTELTFVVPASGNQLIPGDTIGIRTIEVDLTLPTGVVTIKNSYMLRASLQVRPFLNSFQTIERALVTAAEMVKVDGFINADEDHQRQALLEGYVRITRLGFFIAEEAESWRDRFSCGATRVSPRDWPVMNEDRWCEFPERFRKALRRAQVQEANAILTVGTAQDFRRSGLLSKTTGESAAVFRAGTPLDFGISRESLEQLTGYIELRLSTARG